MLIIVGDLNNPQLSQNQLTSPDAGRWYTFRESNLKPAALSIRMPELRYKGLPLKGLGD
jgi:hypothetical protein